jgi:hypothetical protein
MKIRKQILRDACAYFVEKVDNKPNFFKDIVETLNTSVEVEGIIDIDAKLIKNICNYCETQAIYDKLDRYGDFYYKLARYFWV